MRELELLRGIADDVAGVVDETPTRDFGREDGIGADGDPTAYVDRLAEERVLEAVEASQLDLNVCSEEAGWIDNGADRTLIVDPIDGTTNAVRDIPFYCVSLAIARGGLGELEVGLVRNLATGDTYEAVAGEGAWRDSRQLSSGDFDPEDAVRSPILDPDAIPGLVEEIRDVPYVRGLGAAALELALVAQGALDVFLHLRGGLRVVDIAASTLLIREAGGAVATPAGEAPEMPFDPTARTSLVAVGDPDLLSRAEVVA
jgi:NAD+ kinase